MNTPTLPQLQRSLKIAEQIEKLEAEMAAIFQGSAPGSTPAVTQGRKKSQMSAKGRAAIAAAQKARWAKIKGGSKKAPAKAPKAPVKEKKRKFSPAALQKLRDAMKKRWALAKAGKAPAPTASKNKK